MGTSYWQYGRFSAFLLLIVGVTLFGCVKVEQTKQAKQSEPSKQSQQDTVKAKQQEKDVPLAVHPDFADQDKESKQSEQEAEKTKQDQEACAKRLKTTVEVTNKIGMKLRLIPPGEFLMGSPPEETGRHSIEGPQHRVRLTKAFYLSATEVTQQQYQQIVGTNPSYFSADGRGKAKVVDTDTSQHPVTDVSWFDAVEFCNQLSEREGLKPYYRREGSSVTILGGSGYRLPTEAEWEYACRAGTTTAYSFGDDAKQLVEFAWYKENSGEQIQPVGAKPPNPWGLHDMHGNVWEWCADWFGEYTGELAIDPRGPKQATYRVFRGGSWGYDSGNCRAASRSGDVPRYRSVFLGFRVAAVPPSESSQEKASKEAEPGA